MDGRGKKSHVPTGRLDELYSVRISQTVQGIVADISDLWSNSPFAPSQRHGGPAGAGLSNLRLSLQHDTGR